VYVLIAIILAVVSMISLGAGKKTFGLGCGIAAILVFITWLNSGPGHAFIDWFENPTGPEIPDNIPIPGQ